MPKRTFADRCFKDKHGDVVLGQAPNKPLLIFLGLFLLSSTSLFAHNKIVTAVIGVASTSALLWWSILEITSGVNYFRRFIGVLGLFACAIMVMSGYQMLKLL